jgi:4-hydroxy-3-methylbut-2-enyl diphosphate reductase
MRFYEAVKDWAGRTHPHYKIFETICDSTESRQTDVQQLAESVDAVVVVGGRASGNTRRLYEIARQTGKPAFHVESEADLDHIDLGALVAARTIGISAGASTPNWVIRKVTMALETKLFKRRSWWHKALHALRERQLTNPACLRRRRPGVAACFRRSLNFVVLMSCLYVQSSTSNP